jgi:hypothetical protein
VALFQHEAAEIQLVKAGENRRAIVVLPPGAHGRIGDAAQAKWLSRGTLDLVEPRSDMLLSVLAQLGEPAPVGGLAALRFWGQTGERSSAWLAGADPIHLETRLHSLRMRSLRPDELPKSDLKQLFDHLQSTLGNDSELAFAQLGQHGYLCGERPIETAAMSALVLNGLAPDEFMPSGESAAGYHRLLGEVQMVLHEYEANRKRVDAGQLPINSLWLWGGGIAPEPCTRSLPTLYADDPLFRGYWNSCGGEVADWDVEIEHSARDAFVAVMPDFAPQNSAVMLRDYLNLLRRSLRRGAIGSLCLLFQDGLAVQISRWDALRFWRGVSPLLENTDDND